jgi:hypothetical protein
MVVNPEFSKVHWINIGEHLIDYLPTTHLMCFKFEHFGSFPFDFTLEFENELIALFLGGKKPYVGNEKKLDVSQTDRCERETHFKNSGKKNT